MKKGEENNEQLLEIKTGFNNTRMDITINGLKNLSKEWGKKAKIKYK